MEISGTGKSQLRVLVCIGSSGWVGLEMTGMVIAWCTPL